MLNTILILAIFVVSSSLGHVKISVYYETLCPYSADFLVNQFYPVYQEHSDHINAQLIPYGKANTTELPGSFEFECQHGEAECYGNKVHSCALELYPESQSFAFIACSMGTANASSDDNLEQCSISSNIPWADLQDCISTGKGDEYLAANGKVTDELIPTITNSVPTIVFSNTFNRQLQALARTNLADLVVFLNDQIHCDFCQFLPSGSNVISSEKLVFGVALLILVIQKIFA